MNRVKVSLSGFGFMGRFHTIAYRNMPLCYDKFPYIVELYKLQTSKDLNREHTGYLKHVKNLEDLSDTDILDICTPNYMHNEQISKAASHGIKNIYCEKPLYGSYDVETALTGLAESQGITTQVAFMMRFLPAVLRAKRIIDEGLIGKVINFNCRMNHESYINPNRAISWRLEKDKSFGGALVDLGVHVMDLIHFLLGGVSEVRGFTKTVYNERPSDKGLSSVNVDDFAHLELMLKSGAFGTLEVSKVAAGKHDDTGIEIFGTQGSIKVHVDNPDWPDVYLVKDSTLSNGGSLKFKDVEEDINTIYPTHKFSMSWMMNCHMASLYSFIMKTQGDKLKYINLPTFEDSSKACRVLEAAYKSSVAGGTSVSI